MGSKLGVYTLAWVLCAGLVVGCSDTNANQSSPSDHAESGQGSTKATVSNSTATAGTTSKLKQKPKSATNNGNVAFLNAVNEIAYNTFVEASNVGDQMTQVGSSQESMGEFGDFMDTDRILWGQYISKVTATKPQDAVLYALRQNILSDLGKLQHDAQTMENAANNNDPSTITSTSKNMTVTFNDLKQAYSTAVTEMSKYGVQASWTPNG